MREYLLSVEDDGGLVADSAEMMRLGEQLHAEYVGNDPFPHVVIEKLFPESVVRKALENFPAAGTRGKLYDRGYAGKQKRQISPYDCDPYLRHLFMFFNSAPMLAFLEKLTGIQGLIADPYFVGGGVHETRTGGLLGVHADFRVNEKLQLIRRVNLILYLNQEWNDAYNGQLELWSTDMSRRVKSVSPVFNRCVIFNTDETSFHGHPEPLKCPEDVSRKSLALYYYTATPVAVDTGVSRETNYVARPNETSENLRKINKIRQKREARADGRSAMAYRVSKWVDDVKGLFRRAP